MKRTLRSLHRLPQSPPAHPPTQASPQPRCLRFPWLLSPQALRCQVQVFQANTSMYLHRMKFITSLGGFKRYLSAQVSLRLLCPHPLGTGTYTTSSLSTKTTTASDPPNICKVKPQQLQGGSLSSSSSSSSSSSFSQLGCVPPLLPQQQQTPQVYVSQSAAGERRNKTQLYAFKVGSL